MMHPIRIAPRFMCCVVVVVGYISATDPEIEKPLSSLSVDIARELIKSEGNEENDALAQGG